ncbi:VOC family protein [Mycobacterium spongiae]|uniref:VOC family protein n=1 Tax=Mycobacterium spongiae TaxID=886343 RepID=A0A975JZA7_9MYCO|nr:VOC family protein [Mycobacterium spongiae]QUR68469.1 VOC family protein [Mycobacterium spongiae]
MSISFNHTIVASRDKRASAEFLTELFDLPSPTPFGRFMVVTLEHGACLDYADVPSNEEIHTQHYAFLVSDEEFDTIYGKIRSRGLPHWADPGATRPGEINRRDGGRGVYFPDPSGHSMEILTRPYGSGG